MKPNNANRPMLFENANGRAMQIVPIKPVLKPPVPMLLKLRYNGTLSTFAFNFHLRRYTTCCTSCGAGGCSRPCASAARGTRAARRQGLTIVHFSAQPEPFPTLKISPDRLNTPSNPAETLLRHSLNTPETPPKHPRNNP